MNPLLRMRTYTNGRKGGGGPVMGRSGASLAADWMQGLPEAVP